LFKRGLVQKKHILDGRCRKCQIPGSLLTRFLTIKLETVHGQESYLGQVVDETLDRFAHIQLGCGSTGHPRHENRRVLLEAVAERVPAGRILSLEDSEERRPLGGQKIRDEVDKIKVRVDVDRIIVRAGVFISKSPVDTIAERLNIQTVNFDVLQGLVALAASLSDIKVLERSIIHGGLLDANSEYFTTAIHAAARRGKFETVKWLLGKGAQAFPKHTTRCTPLDVACFGGHEEIVKHFLNYEHKLHPCLAPQLEAAIRLALKGGHANLVDLFVEMRKDKGNPADGPVEPAVSKEEVLLIAAANGNEEVVGKMLNSGVDIDGVGMREAREAYRRNALEFAASTGRLNVVKLLLERGSSHESDRYHNAFVLAVREQRDDVARFLLQDGANINHVAPRPNHWRRRGTALMTASSHDDYKMVQFLLSKGADISAEVKGSKENQGSCALTSACRRGHIEVARLLIEAGVSPNKLEWTRGKGGKSNVYYARKSGVPGIVEALWKLGAKAIVDHQDHW
jgi:ankyrin repeat protein